MELATRGNLVRVLKDPVWLRRVLHTFISVSSIVILLYGSLYALINANNPKYYHYDFLKHGYKYSPYFLTLWISVSHILYYHMYSAIDIVEVYYNNDKKLLQLAETIHKVASYFLFTIIFPMSVFVTFAFWSAFLWDRETMYPTVMDELLPSWVNHAMHSAPIPLALLYMFTSNKHEPSKLSAITGIVTFQSLYWGLFVAIRMTHGKWVYLLMNQFSQMQINIILAVALVVPILFLLLGYKVNSAFKVIRSHLPKLIGL